MPNHTSTNLLQEIILNPYIVQIFYITGAIASIVCVLYITYSILRVKINEISFSSFYDLKNNEYVQERQFNIKWGKTFCGNVKLPIKLRKNSENKLWYKPSIGPFNILDQEHYETEKLGDENKIKLANKNFFKTEEIEKIRIRSESKQDDSSKTNLIDHIIITENNNAKKIIIENNNEEDIHNYTIDLPRNVSYEKGFEYLNTIDEVVSYSASPPDVTPFNIHGSKLTLLVNLKKNSDGGILELPMLT